MLGEAYGLGFDEVDALTGPKIGRPKSATYRTADVVGLDTLAHVVKTMQDTLPNDPWHAYFKTPEWLSALIGKGALGQKTRCGIFRKQGREIQVLDLGIGMRARHNFDLWVDFTGMCNDLPGLQRIRNGDQKPAGGFDIGGFHHADGGGITAQCRRTLFT